VSESVDAGLQHYEVVLPGEEAADDLIDGGFVPGQVERTAMHLVPVHAGDGGDLGAVGGADDRVATYRVQ
jgi:hypothetical protein